MPIEPSARSSSDAEGRGSWEPRPPRNTDDRRGVPLAHSRDNWPRNGPAWPGQSSSDRAPAKQVCPTPAARCKGRDRPGPAVRLVLKCGVCNIPLPTVPLMSNPRDAIPSYLVLDQTKLLQRRPSSARSFLGALSLPASAIIRTRAVHYKTPRPLPCFQEPRAKAETTCVYGGNVYFQSSSEAG